MKALSFACWSVLLLTALHKQALTGLWQHKEKNFALTISLNAPQQCRNQSVSTACLCFFFNAQHLQLLSPLMLNLCLLWETDTIQLLVWTRFSRSIGILYHIVHILIAFLCYLSPKPSVRDAQVFCFVFLWAFLSNLRALKLRAFDILWGLHNEILFK